MGLQNNLAQSIKDIKLEYRSASPEERAEIIGRAAGLALAIGIPAWIGWVAGKEISDYFQFIQPAKTLTEVGGAAGLVALLTPAFGSDVKDIIGDFFNSAAEKYIGFKDYLSSMRVDSS